MFQLTEEQHEKLRIWREEQNAKVVEKQKESRGSKPGDPPYYGATGGGYTYEFTPTSIGLITKVTNNLTHETLDLSDYDNW